MSSDSISQRPTYTGKLLMASLSRDVLKNTLIVCMFFLNKSKKKEKTSETEIYNSL